MNTMLKTCSCLFIALGLAVMAAPTPPFQDKAPTEAKEHSELDKRILKFFEVAGMEALYQKTIDQAIKQQVKTGLIPADKVPVLREFFTKYMSFGALRDDMVGIYSSHFDIKDIDGLIAFYESDLGKKFADKTPDLMIAGMNLGQQKVEENMGELMKLFSQ